MQACRPMGDYKANSYKSSGSLYNEIKNKFQIIGAETRIKHAYLKGVIKKSC